MSGSDRRWVAVGIALVAILVASWLADRATSGKWVDRGIDFVAHQFYEQPLLAQIRRPSQLLLVRMHLASSLAMVALATGLAPWMSLHARRWWAIFCVGYALRALIWVVGGNLPLVPGDSCHYIEV